MHPQDEHFVWDEVNYMRRNWYRNASVYEQFLGPRKKPNKKTLATKLYGKNRSTVKQQAAVRYYMKQYKDHHPDPITQKYKDIPGNGLPPDPIGCELLLKIIGYYNPTVRQEYESIPTYQESGTY